MNNFYINFSIIKSILKFLNTFNMKLDFIKLGLNMDFE